MLPLGSAHSEDQAIPQVKPQARVLHALPRDAAYGLWSCAAWGHLDPAQGTPTAKGRKRNTATTHSTLRMTQNYTRDNIQRSSFSSMERNGKHFASSFSNKTMK
jgi:hypothetical protein